MITTAIMISNNVKPAVRRAISASSRAGLGLAPAARAAARVVVVRRVVVKRFRVRLLLLGYSRQVFQDLDVPLIGPSNHNTRTRHSRTYAQNAFSSTSFSQRNSGKRPG